MSSRALRKLQGTKELDIVENSVDNEEYNDFVPAKPRSKKKNVVNPFDLLNHSEDVDEVEEKSEEEEKEEVDQITYQGVGEGQKDKPNAEGKRKKRKKKKKGKGKQEADAVKPAENEDEIDASIREVNEMLGTAAMQTSGPASEGQSTSVVMDTKALLGIEHRYLNAENELRKRFGSNVVRTENTPRQRRGHRRIYHRSTWLVSPKQSWPHMGKSGVTMKLLENRNGYNYFTFEHAPFYQNVQFQFLDAVESLDPNNISAILNMHAYHIDAMLQLSEICKMGEDYQMAAELIERALYCCECSFHTLFSLTQGTSRLEYKRAENRSFFIGIFRHLVFIGQRGCNRTALEYCKLLLSFDPESDPLGVLLMIDFYALRSEQYGFLIRVFEEWEGHRNLSQLPNFAFSVALAYFHFSRKQGNTEKADGMIQNALIMFPSVLMALMDKCGVALASSITKHLFFTTQATISEPLALKQLVSLYAGRTSSVWKEPEVIDWLTANVLRVLERVDVKDPFVDEASKKRRVRYQGTPRNVYRHIVMSDITDSSASLPIDLANMPVMSYDPLPPQDSVCSYTRPERLRRATGEDHNPLSLFFRSLLPSYNAQAPSDPVDQAQARLVEELNQAGAEGGPRPLGETEIARGVENLMGAMRELLNTLSFRGPPEGEGEGEDGEPNNDGEWEDEEQ